MLKKVNKFGIIILALTLFSSCGVSKNNTVKRTVKNYDWSPPSTAPSRSADVTLILVRPSFGKTFKDGKEPIFKKFRNNMADDFEEMLSARGYSIRGPFASYDEVVFRDKQDADLLMEIEIDFNYEADQGGIMHGGLNTVAAMFGRTVYEYYLEGDLFIGGKINITLKEPSTQEKLWIKSIPFEDKTVYLKTKKYSRKSACFTDANYLNAMESILDEYYQSSMNLGWKYLEPAELKQLKVQVKAIRKKKTY